VGSVGMAPVPVGRNANGSLRYEYQPVEIDEALLSNIARMTGGRYFRARDAAALQNIYAQIDLMERAPVHSTTVVRYRELYRWPLTIGLLALFAEFAIVAWRAPLP
jgi:Ca-activated chloride channel homolog